MVTKVSIEKKLILEFALLGAIGSCSRTFPSAPPYQMQRTEESWRIEVDMETAEETLRVLRELTSAVAGMISTGAE